MFLPRKKESMFRLVGICVLLVVGTIPPHFLFAQGSGLNVFEQVLEYADNISTLNERFATQLELKDKLIQERELAQQRLVATANELTQIQSAGIVQSFKLLESRLLAELASLDVAESARTLQSNRLGGVTMRQKLHVNQFESAASLSIGGSN